MKNLLHLHGPPKPWRICWQLHFALFFHRVFTHCLLFSTWRFLFLIVIFPWSSQTWYSSWIFCDEIEVFIFTFLFFITCGWRFECNKNTSSFSSLQPLYVDLMSHDWPNKLFKWKLYEIFVFLDCGHLSFPFFSKDLKIFINFSTLVLVFPKAWSSFVISMNLANISPID